MGYAIRRTDLPLSQRLDKIHTLSKLQLQAYDAACDNHAYDPQGLAELIEDCLSMDAAECRNFISIMNLED